LAGEFDKRDLYPVIGDPDPPQGGAKELAAETPPRPRLQQLMDPESSLVGEADQVFLELLDNWVGDPGRKPWMLLDVLEAPLTSQSYMKWSLGQMLRLDAARQRRIDRKFCHFPLLLYLLTLPNVSDVWKIRICEMLINA